MRCRTDAGRDLEKNRNLSKPIAQDARLQELKEGEARSDRFHDAQEGRFASDSTINQKYLSLCGEKPTTTKKGAR